MSGGHRRDVEVLPPPGRASLRAVGSRDRLRHPREALQKVKWQEGRIKSLMHKRDLVMTTV